MKPIPFNLSLARQLAEFSRRAYCMFGGDYLWSSSTDTVVLVEDIGDAIVLAFRGTKNVRNWLTDLQVLRTPLARQCDPEKNCGCKVAASRIEIHSGFLAAADSILPKIISALLPPGADKTKVKPLILTGHSLGGALAPICAYFLEREGFTVQAVYTFASPRSGNAAWRDEYNSLLGGKTFRIACVGDLVPLLPGIFTPLIDGYRHLGAEVLADGHRLMMEPNHYTELALDGARAFLALRRGDLDFILDFHSIEDDYQASLNSVTTIA